jgi:hypothetical protein
MAFEEVIVDVDQSNRVSLHRADSLEHDFVLNEWVWKEKTDHANKSSAIARFWTSFARMPKAVLVPFVIMMTTMIMAVILGLAGLANPGSEFSGFLVWLSLIGFISLFALTTGASLMQRGLATNLAVNDSGIKFIWRKLQTHNSPVFRWEQMVSATIFQLPEFKSAGLKEGKYLKLRFKTASLTTSQHWWIWTSGAKLNHNYELPFAHEECYFDTIAFEIPLDALTRDADAGVLLSLVTQRLGVDVVGDVLQLDTADGAPSFTQLWLDEAHSFRRKSIESLETEKTLQSGKYSVVERIASGGQATVYRALDHSLEPARVVVLKELVLPVGAGSEVRKRSFESVKNEAMLLGSLSHPGIIRLIDNFIEDHRAYLVLEHVEGITLRDLVEKQGPLSEEKVLLVVKQLCDIFGYLHGQSPPVVHRDFSPDNLMLMSDDNVKLLDFNVALQSESSATKTVVGKHHYIAPEQFRGKPCTQSDLYSIGATIYFLLTGKDPVSLKTATLADIDMADTPLDIAVKRLMAMELSERLQSIHELKSLLFTDE